MLCDYMLCVCSTQNPTTLPYLHRHNHLQIPNSSQSKQYAHSRRRSTSAETKNASNIVNTSSILKKSDPFLFLAGLLDHCPANETNATSTNVINEMRSDVCPRESMTVKGRGGIDSGFGSIQLYKPGWFLTMFGMRNEYPAFVWPWWPLERLSNAECPYFHWSYNELDARPGGNCSCNAELGERCCDCTTLWREKHCCAKHEYCCRAEPGGIETWECCPLHPSNYIAS